MMDQERYKLCGRQVNELSRLILSQKNEKERKELRDRSLYYAQRPNIEKWKKGGGLRLTSAKYYTTFAWFIGSRALTFALGLATLITS